MATLDGARGAGTPRKRAATTTRRRRNAVPMSVRKESRPRRQEVIDAAAKIFRDKGFAGTSTQDLGDALGILKGSIYYYIDSKEDILFAIIEEQHEATKDDLAMARLDEGPPLERLAKVVERNIDRNLANLDKAAVFYSEFRFLSRERQKRVVALRDEFEHFVRELLGECQTVGVICPDLELRIASSTMLTMLNTLFRWYRPRGVATAAEVKRNVSLMVLNSVQCGPSCAHRPSSKKKRS